MTHLSILYYLMYFKYVVVGIFFEVIDVSYESSTASTSTNHFTSMTRAAIAHCKKPKGGIPTSFKMQPIRASQFRNWSQNCYKSTQSKQMEVQNAGNAAQREEIKSK